MTAILVVDDDAALRTTMGKLLTRAGHTVLEAANGVEAEEIVAKNAVELLITDIIMPDKEGLMLVRDLKRRTPGLRIIAMSGGGRTGAFSLLEAASQFGADAVLRKPFRGGDLIKTVEAAMGSENGAPSSAG